MLWISIILVAFVAIACLCGILLVRTRPEPCADVEPMKKTLERRIREGAEFRL